MHESASGIVEDTALARIGPVTSVFETLATAVGAGVLLGGVLIGAAGMVAGWSRDEFAKRSLTDGYMGGLAGVCVVAVDLLVRYVV
jgi:hypothetical protein